MGGLTERSIWGMNEKGNHRLGMGLLPPESTADNFIRVVQCVPARIVLDEFVGNPAPPRRGMGAKIFMMFLMKKASPHRPGMVAH
jgi:hypothetical protein